jgi:hypothetical protein
MAFSSIRPCGFLVVFYIRVAAQFARAVEVPDCDRNLAGGCVGAPVTFYQQRFYAPMLASIDQNIPKLDEHRLKVKS